MEIPRQPGMYIVTLNNVEPISVNAHDPRVAHKAIKVTRANCKVGKAKDLAARARNYAKTFGSHNVNFHPIAVTEHYQEIERDLLKQLDGYRVRGPTGRKNEWLHSIAPEQAFEHLRRVLERSGRSYRLLAKSLA